MDCDAAAPPSTGWSSTSGRAPAVAVVVPAHDAARFVADALRSLQRQTCAEWICVVVDDGSTDETAQVVGTFLHDDRFRLVRQPRAGVAAARNAGLAAVAGSRARFVSFLDADDVLVPEAYEVLLEASESSAGAVGAYGTAEYVDSAGLPFAPGLHPARQRDRRAVQGLRLRPVPVHDPLTTFPMLVVVGPVWPSAVALLRLDVVTGVGGFDESLTQCEDWDLCIRASRRGPLVFVDEQVAWYRRHDANLTNSTGANDHQVHLVRCRAWASEDNSRAQRAIAGRGWRALQHRRAYHALRGCVAAVRARSWSRVRTQVPVAVAELGELARVRPPSGPTGSPLGAPPSRPVDDTRLPASGRGITG